MEQGEGHGHTQQLPWPWQASERTLRLLSWPWQASWTDVKRVWLDLQVVQRT